MYRVFQFQTVNTFVIKTKIACKENHGDELGIDGLFDFSSLPKSGAKRIIMKKSTKCTEN